MAVCDNGKDHDAARLWIFYARLWTLLQILQCGMLTGFQRLLCRLLKDVVGMVIPSSALPLESTSVGTFHDLPVSRGLLLLPFLIALELVGRRVLIFAESQPNAIGSTYVDRKEYGSTHPILRSSNLQYFLILCVSHVITILYVLYDAPFVWDYQYCGLQMELSVVVATFNAICCEIGIKSNTNLSSLNGSIRNNYKTESSKLAKADIDASSSENSKIGLQKPLIDGGSDSPHDADIRDAHYDDSKNDAGHGLRQYYARNSPNHDPRNEDILHSSFQLAQVLTVTQLTLFYFAAGFWKLNSSFLNARVSCAPLLILQAMVYVLQCVLRPLCSIVSGFGLLSHLFGSDTNSLVSSITHRILQPFSSFLVQSTPMLTALLELAMGPLLLLGFVMTKERFVMARSTVVGSDEVSSDEARTPFKTIGSTLARFFGLFLAMFFHGLIAICPPPNGAGGFSVTAVTRYIFYLGPYIGDSDSSGAFARIWDASSAVSRSVGRNDAHSRGSLRLKVAALVFPYIYGAWVQDFASTVYFWLIMIYFPVLRCGIVGNRRVELEDLPRFDEKRDMIGIERKENDTVAVKGPETVAKHIATQGYLFFLFSKQAIARRILVLAILSLLLLLNFFYAFGTTTLGVQDMGAPTMYAMLALYHGFNHWFVPVGWMFRTTWAHGEKTTSSVSTTSWGNATVLTRETRFFPTVSLLSAKPYSTVRIMYTNSDHINSLYPSEATSVLDPVVQQILLEGGHTGRIFTPGSARVLGTGWLQARDRQHGSIKKQSEQGSEESDDSGVGESKGGSEIHGARKSTKGTDTSNNMVEPRMPFQLPYLLPGIELQRLAREMREEVSILGSSREIVYEYVNHGGVPDQFGTVRYRLSIKKDSESPEESCEILYPLGMAPKDTANGKESNTVPSNRLSANAACSPRELGFLRGDGYPFWARKLSLYFPMLLNEDGEEMGCVA